MTVASASIHRGVVADVAGLKFPGDKRVCVCKSFPVAKSISMHSSVDVLFGTTILYVLPCQCMSMLMSMFPSSPLLLSSWLRRTKACCHCDALLQALIAELKVTKSLGGGRLCKEKSIESHSNHPKSIVLDLVDMHALRIYSA